MRKTVVSLALVLSFLLAAVGFYLFMTNRSDKGSGEPKLPNPVDRAFWFKVQERLKVAKERSEENLEEHFKPLEDFFKQAKDNTPKFAAEALSWGSKWRLIVDYVPFTAGDRNETFIKKKFEEIVFDPQEFQKVLEASIQSYLSKIESIENQLLVDLRQDLASLPEGSKLANNSQGFTEDSFKKAIEAAIKAGGNSAKVEVTKDLVTEIATNVLAAVGTRLVVSGSVLAAGGAASWATLGASVIISLIVDQIISYVWDWYADPKGNLALKVNGQLDEMKTLIIQGNSSGDKPVKGLKQRLLEFARERTKIRDTAIQSQIFGT